MDADVLSGRKSEDVATAAAKRYADAYKTCLEELERVKAERDAALAKIEDLKFEIEVIRNDELGAAVWAETEALRFKLSDAMTECERLRAELKTLKSTTKPCP